MLAAAAASAGKAEPSLHPLLSLSAILTVVGPKPSTPAVVLGAMSIYLSILSASEPKQKKEDIAEDEEKRRRRRKQEI